ncbi:MAG TPA: DUF3300 domain-containing protein [Bryobacteraceae bacterium]|nr:DUF3300 domain-containing protein [Bryobacteraceae bacterium]
MKRPNQILTLILAAGAVSAQAWAQNYPPPPPAQYPQQQYPPQQYPQQPAYGQQPPYYGQQPDYGAQPPYFAPQQLDALVGRIALYPDPLLAQMLTAATFPNQIPDADAWARAHAYMTGDAMARAIRDDGLPWDPSVLALLPFPTVLDMMSGDMGWTQQLGNAVLANRAAVMDAVQRQRAMALNYGYLRSGGQIRVVNAGPGDIEILPVDPAYVYVPYYDPYVVYARPRPGFFVGGAITFGPRIVIGSFAPWGWGNTAFGWHDHRIIVNNRPWERTWVNRQTYVHPYVAPRPQVQDHRMEHHELREYRGPEHREPERRGPERRNEDRRDRR